MKIERDKWYLDRMGERRFVVCTDKPGSSPIIAYDEDGNTTEHCADGGRYRRIQDPADLVAPAPEPVRGYVVVDAQSKVRAFTLSSIDAHVEAEKGKGGFRVLDLSTAREASHD